MPPPATTSSSSKRFVAGRVTYVLEAVLGRGGSAVVYRARHASTGRLVALKVIHHELMTSPKARHRFARECKVYGALRSEHIVRIYDAGTGDDGRLFLAMELLTGAPLRREVAPDDAGRVEMLLQLCEALATSHGAGIVHRDVKPSNLLCDREPAHLYLLDFGLAKRVAHQGDTAVTATGVAMGSAPYLAPEQIVDASAVGPKADIWSMGVVAFELLTGQHPFAGTLDGMLERVLTTTPARIDGPWGDIVERMLRREPAERPHDVAEVAAALGADDARLKRLHASLHHDAARRTGLRASRLFGALSPSDDDTGTLTR